MMQLAGKLSPLPRCPIKSDQEGKCREKKKIASCRQHRSKRYANCSSAAPGVSLPKTPSAGVAAAAESEHDCG
jgi:hypothetical protein